MSEAPIEALNQGLQAFQEDIRRDSLASRRLEIAVVSFGSEVRVEQDWITADEFIPPVLTTKGLTHTGTAIHKALDMIQARKEVYRANRITYYRPWVFMITDGEPVGEEEGVVASAARRIREDEQQKRVAFFAVGVEDANMEKLQATVVRVPVRLKGLNFVEMFQWLSRSMQSVSQGQTYEQVPLQPLGWGTV